MKLRYIPFIGTKITWFYTVRTKHIILKIMISFLQIFLILEKKYESKNSLKF